LVEIFLDSEREKEKKNRRCYEFVKIRENWNTCLADRKNEARPLEDKNEGREARSTSVSDRRTMNNNATISTTSEKKEP